MGLLGSSTETRASENKLHDLDVMPRDQSLNTSIDGSLIRLTQVDAKILPEELCVEVWLYVHNPRTGKTPRDWFAYAFRFLDILAQRPESPCTCC